MARESKPPADDADLAKLKRDELDKAAAAAGVPNADELPNKEAVIEAIEAPNPALAPVPDEADAEATYKVLASRPVHGTDPGGTFTAAHTPQLALLIESGHIKRTNPQED